MRIPSDIAAQIRRAVARAETEAMLADMAAAVRDAERRLHDASEALMSATSDDRWLDAVVRRNLAFQHLLKVLHALQVALDGPGRDCPDRDAPAPAESGRADDDLPYIAS
jgi:hypothetical protein